MRGTKKSKDPNGIFARKRGEVGKKKKAEKTERPEMETSYGTSLCLLCRRPFERKKWNQRYDSNYCRMTHWHYLHRRRTPLARVKSVDGHEVDFPAVDVDLARQQIEQMERELQERKAMLEQLAK